MMEGKGETMCYDLVEAYFRRCAEELDSIELEDLLAIADVPALCLQGTGRVDTLIESLIRERMRPFEEAMFFELQTGMRSHIPVGSEVVLLQSLRDHSSPQRVLCDLSLARVSNRLGLDFFERFLLPSGGIDWVTLAMHRPAENERREV